MKINSDMGGGVICKSILETLFSLETTFYQCRTHFWAYIRFTLEYFKTKILHCKSKERKYFLTTIAVIIHFLFWVPLSPSPLSKSLTEWRQLLFSALRRFSLQVVLLHICIPFRSGTNISAILIGKRSQTSSNFLMEIIWDYTRILTVPVFSPGAALHLLDDVFQKHSSPVLLIPPTPHFCPISITENS